MTLLEEAFEALQLHKGTALGLFISLVVLYQLATAIYNLYLHPLRNYPGPILYRASPWPWAIGHTQGLISFKTQKWHDEYGHVVRIAPNHLSFTDPKAWKDIYGHRIGVGKEEFTKAESMTNSIEDFPKQIISADRQEHQRLRRALSHGFSDSAIRSQEPTIAKHVDKLMRGLKIKSVAQDGSTQMLNIESWMNWTTFDVVGELVFGLSFGCLERFDYHPWVIFMLQSLKDGAIMNSLHYVGYGWVNKLLYRTVGAQALKKMTTYTDNMLNYRLENGQQYEDLFEGLVKKQAEWEMTFEELSANAMILILAGSETTATLLSGCLFLLVSNPDKLEKLQHEIRTTFHNDSDITFSAVNQLSYMLAVLNEALRLYPPVTSGLLRVVPRGGEYIADQFVPGGTMVECQHWSMNHSKENWTAPWEFRPERFFEVNSEDALEALQAFSIGPRNCVGRNLAYVEMRFILARLVYNFDIRLDDSSKDWIGRQRSYPLWSRIPLQVYLSPATPR